MFNLIKNELTKIFSKKGIYVILVIFLILEIAGVVINKIINNMDLEEILYYGNDEVIAEYEGQLKSIDKSTTEGKQEYANIQTELEIMKLIDKYGYDSWQTTLIYDKLYNILIDINYYKNGLTEFIYEERTQEELETQYNKIIELFEKDDWKYFAEEELKDAKEQIKVVEQKIKETTDINKLTEYKMQKEKLDITIEILEKRINNNIKYGEDSVLSSYQYSAEELITYRYQKEVTPDNYKTIKGSEFNFDFKQYYQDVIERYFISKYKIDNNIFKDTESENSLVNTLKDNSSRILFIIITAILIGGTIVSEEFNKGTIKLLLVRPYNRRKILFAKIIATFITILISIVTFLIITTLVNGIAYGFNSINEPVLIFNYNTNTVISMNILKYVVVIGIRMAPMIIILTLLALTCGVILNNSGIAMICSFLVYMGTNIISGIAQLSNVKWLKFIPTLNWDLTQYLYGKLPLLEGMTITFSLIMCIAVCVILLIISFENFARKNIKNV